jgi:hypothetical protein
MADVLILTLLAFADLLILIILRIRGRSRRRVDRTLASLASYVQLQNGVAIPQRRWILRQAR